MFRRVAALVAWGMLGASGAAGCGDDLDSFPGSGGSSAHHAGFGGAATATAVAVLATKRKMVAPTRGAAVGLTALEVSRLVVPAGVGVMQVTAEPAVVWCAKLTSSGWASASR